MIRLEYLCDMELAYAIFAVEDARFQWLNHCLCLAEGSVHPETLHLQLRVYVCRLEESRRP